MMTFANALIVYGVHCNYSHTLRWIGTHEIVNFDTKLDVGWTLQSNIELGC